MASISLIKVLVGKLQYNGGNIMRYKLLRRINNEPEVFGMYDTFSQAYGKMERNYYNYMSECEIIHYNEIYANEAVVVDNEDECHWLIVEEREEYNV